MSSFACVLDACVLIPAALRDTLLRAADAELYAPRWSATIVEETRRNLVSELGLSESQAQRLVDTIQTYFPEAIVTGYEPLIDAMTNDPKDRHVLAAAVVAGAEIIVTSNLRDFPRSALAPFGIEAQSPDTFLINLFHDDSERMVQIVVEQAQDLHAPSMSVDKLLDRLARQAPQFAALI